MANRLLPVTAAAAAFAAGVGVAALYFAPSAPPEPSATAANAPGMGYMNPTASPQRPVGASAVRGSLPALHQSTANEPDFGAPVADPRMQALEAQVARLAALVEQQQGALPNAAPAGAVGTASSARPLYPEPFILPGTENRAGGPILAAYGPPPPFNTGSRAPDPPAVPGAGCSTCESGAAAQR